MHLPHHSVANAGNDLSSNSSLWIALEAMDTLKTKSTCRKGFLDSSRVVLGHQGSDEMKWDPTSPPQVPVS